VKGGGVFFCAGVGWKGQFIKFGKGRHVTHPRENINRIILNRIVLSRKKRPGIKKTRDKLFREILTTYELKNRIVCYGIVLLRSVLFTRDKENLDHYS
jgi:hypothetical protein